MQLECMNDEAWINSLVIKLLETELMNQWMNVIKNENIRNI